MPERNVTVRSAEDALVPREKSQAEDASENVDHLLWDAISGVVSPRHRKWLRWPDPNKVLPEVHHPAGEQP